MCIRDRESRGRLSYLTPDRTKPITARKLGDDFDRAAVLTLLEQNAHRAAEKTVPIPEYHTAETNRTERGKTQKIDVYKRQAFFVSGLIRPYHKLKFLKLKEEHNGIFCKHKTAYEMRISDWSSDVCSSDLP